MSQTWMMCPTWLLQSALGGGLLLLVAWAVMTRSGQPVRRHRLGALGVTAALLAAVLALGPRWLVLPVALPFLSTPPEAGRADTAANPEELDFLVEADGLETPDLSSSVQIPLPTRRDGFSFAGLLGNLPSVLGGLWALGATTLLGRWLLGWFGLVRLLRRARPAPDHVAALFAEMTSHLQHKPRLLVADKDRVPFSCGLLRPTIVLSPDLCDASEGALRWVFAHELTHLERRDAWTAFLLSLGQVIYFYLPWFWWLRRQIRLCQEYLADAAAARQAGSPEDYAQFLLSLTTRPAVPLGTTGVTGNKSDLYRRVAMLLQTPGSVEKRCGWLWSLAATLGLLALAVVVSGIGLRAEAADDKKDAKEVEIKVVLTADDKDTIKDVKNKVIILRSQDGKTYTATVDGDLKAVQGKKGELPKVAFPDVDDLIKQLPPGLSKDQIDHFRQQMQKAREEMQKAMEQLKKQVPQAGGRARGEVIRKALGEARKETKGLDKDALDRALELLLKNEAQETPGRAANVRVLGLRTAWDGAGQGRLGIQVDTPSDALAEQLDLPKGMGLVITAVVDNSAASKAGLKANDILLSLAGKAVTNDAEALVALVKDLKAGTPVEATVLRKGKKETIKGITVAESPVRRSLRILAEPVGKIQVVPILPAQPKIPVPPGQPAQPVRMLGRIQARTVPSGANQVMMSINRNNDNFTGTYQEGTVTVSVSGTVEGGKAKAGSIEVKDGEKSTKFDSVDKVPEQHRDKVNKLLDGVGKGGAGAQIEIKTRTAPATPATPRTPATPATPQPKKPTSRDILSTDAARVDYLVPVHTGLRFLVPLMD